LRCRQGYCYHGFADKETMHEIKIAEELSAIVIGAAAGSGLKKVDRVNVCFGEFIQVVPSIFERAFREAVRETPADSALLDIEIIPAELRCLACGTLYNPDGETYACGACGSEEISVVHGKELFIKSIEGG
jgi:hydrogenase nickel incorporation protein HypA/HybF